MTPASAGPGPIEALLLFAVAAVATALVTGRLIPRLAARELGKAIRVDGPAHQAKEGTPTMGGLAFVPVLVLAAAWLWWRHGAAAPWFVTVGTCAFGALGLLDDVAGLARRSGERELGVGLTARRMFAVQCLAAVGLGLWWLRLSGAAVEPAGAALAVAIFALTVVATVNGANITDGLDGLAAGVCGLALGAAAAIVALAPPRLGAVPALAPADAAALAGLGLVYAGACLGFLRHNRHPARVFMGNVGSMGLGAALALIALAGGVWWLLPLVAGVLVIEVASVLLQVGYYKLTGGQRILRMAPIHHHFEAGDLTEAQVVRRFWVVGALCAAAGVAVAAALRT